MDVAGPSNYNHVPLQPKTESSEEVDQLLEDDDFGDEEDEDPNVFKVRESLHPHTVHTKSTQEVHRMIHDATIDLNPSYQRDLVWTIPKQMHLIDSIFRNFYIPPVVFAVQRDEDGYETRVCVDGKQRLTSIVNFFDGTIPHKDPITKKKFWYRTSDAHKGQRLEIPKFWKDWFATRPLTIVEYEHISPLQEREIFQRVQLGVALMNAEKLKAVSSHWSEWICKLEERHINNEDGLSCKVEFETKRGRDFQNLVALVYCCHSLPDPVLPSAQRIEKWLSRDDKPSSAFVKRIETVLCTFWVIASTPEYNEGFTKINAKKIAPIEFIFIGVLLYELRDEDYVTQARAIYILRHGVREQFKDIKNNDTVGKALWKMIDKLRDNPTKWLSTRPPNSSASKRKRTTTRDDTDSDEEFSPNKATKKSTKARPKHAK